MKPTKSWADETELLFLLKSINTGHAVKYVYMLLLSYATLQDKEGTHLFVIPQRAGQKKEVTK